LKRFGTVVFICFNAFQFSASCTRAAERIETASKVPEIYTTLGRSTAAIIIIYCHISHGFKRRRRPCSPCDGNDSELMPAFRIIGRGRYTAIEGMVPGRHV
jgi:hypothetical protein